MKKQSQDLKPSKGAIHFEVIMTTMLLFKYLMVNTWMTRNGKMKWIITLISLVFLGMYVAIDALNSTTLLLVLIVILNLVVQPAYYYMNAKKMMRTVKNFAHPIKYSITKEGIFTEQNSGKTITNWFMFMRVFESRQLMLLYMGIDQVIILPKALLSKEDLKVIKTYVLEQGSKIKHCNFKKI